MLLNEFLKAHRKLEQQQATIDWQQNQIEVLTNTVRRISERGALRAPAPQIAANGD